MEGKRFRCGQGPGRLALGSIAQRSAQKRCVTRRATTVHRQNQSGTPRSVGRGRSFVLPASEWGPDWPISEDWAACNGCTSSARESAMTEAKISARRCPRQTSFVDTSTPSFWIRLPRVTDRSQNKIRLLA
jgi:hypothetical protein